MDLTKYKLKTKTKYILLNKTFFKSNSTSSNLKSLIKI